MNEKNKEFSVWESIKTHKSWLLGFAVINLLIFIFVPWLLGKCTMGADYSGTGAIGDTIGGTVGPIVAIIAATLTFLAYIEQLKLNSEQMKQFQTQEKQFNEQLAEQKRQFDIQLAEQDKINKRQSFESHFFELLRMYKEFVGEMEIEYIPFNIANGFENSQSIKIKGKAVFEIMYKEIKRFYDAEDKYFINEKGFMRLRKSYDYMFNYGEQSDEGIFSEEGLKIKEKIPSLDSISVSEARIYNPPAISPDLAQYLRIMHQIVKYVVEYDSGALDDLEKYKYLKLLRIQLSIYEQFILLLNAFNYWGKPWLDKHYLTKWRISKNIPMWILTSFELLPTDVYRELGLDNNGKYNGKYVFEFVERANS